MMNKIKKYTDEERLALAKKLDKELDEFLDSFPKREPLNSEEKVKPPEDWLEEFDKHPFFMKELPKAGEALHPLYEGLQQLKYDPTENTPLELAHAYKEDGNFNFKHSNFRLAIIAYTEGIKVKCQDNQLEAALHNNRAAAHYLIGNYRSSLRDCEIALKYNPDYHKARFRAVQCCLKTNKFAEGLKHCDIAETTTTRDNSTLCSFVELRATLLSERAKFERNARKRERHLKQVHDNEQKLLDMLRGRKLRFKPEDLSMENLTPSFDALRQYRVSEHEKENSILIWPVVLMYPEYEVSDFIQQFPENTTFEEQLQQVFEQLPPWDNEKKYEWRHLTVYYISSAGEARQVPVTLQFSTVLESPGFEIVQGTPAFYVFAANSRAEQEFLRGHK